MKKVFMILGTCLLAALVVVSCNKKNPTPAPQPEPEPEPQPEGFSMEVNIDGNFAEWDALTAQTADEYYAFEENTDPDYNGLLRMKLASDADNIYVYLELNYEYVYIKDNSDKPVTGGGSWTGFIPDHAATPGALIVYVGCDDKANSVYGARRIAEDNELEITDDDPSMWEYMGFDAFPQYYFCYDDAAGKMAFGWNQNNWPELHDSGWTDDMIGQPLGDHGMGWWGDDVEGTPVSDNTVSNWDTFKFSDVMKIKDPASNKEVDAVKIEFAMDREAILESGAKVSGQAVIGAFYENISHVAHQTESRGAGKLPSGDKPVTIKLK